MKKVFESEKSFQNEDDLFARFSAEEILNVQSMSCVRGGDNGEPIIIIPPPPG
jgi:hypothetical protein